MLVEAGAKKTFAIALDWPGWGRSGRNEEEALEALSAYAPRYAPVARAAGLDLPGADPELEVVQRVTGGASTDYGVPHEVVDDDRQPLAGEAAERTLALVSAAWELFDRVVAKAPSELRKGPRGGGRDRDQIAEHVFAAEDAYARKLGVRIKAPAVGDTAGIQSARRTLLDALGSGEAGEKRWPPRYAARRIAWHAVDHAWEIEDRSE